MSNTTSRDFWQAWMILDYSMGARHPQPLRKQAQQLSRHIRVNTPR